MTIYGLGFTALFAILALMYANVWMRRDTLKLGRLDAFDARTGTWGYISGSRRARLERAWRSETQLPV
jgi:hypothetical protein